MSRQVQPSCVRCFQEWKRLVLEEPTLEEAGGLVVWRMLQATCDMVLDIESVRRPCRQSGSDRKTTAYLLA
jgi:hypothetical protein